MSEFEPCPITGVMPILVECSEMGGYRIQSRSIVDCHWNTSCRRFLSEYDAIRWWNKEYVPIARKYAEYLESQKPVEFHVGDLVGLSLEGFEENIVDNQLTPSGRKTARIVSIDGNGKIAIDKEFYSSDSKRHWPKEWLRLISRPKKLTLADLPEIEDCEWRVDRDGSEFKAILNRKGDTLECWAYSTEHEAVAAALDFLKKIWAAKPEGV